MVQVLELSFDAAYHCSRHASQHSDHEPVQANHAADPGHVTSYAVFLQTIDQLMLRDPVKGTHDPGATHLVMEEATGLLSLTAAETTAVTCSASRPLQQHMVAQVYRYLSTTHDCMIRLRCNMEV